MSFDRTYEGLKHHDVRHAAFDGLRFDRTYEGLKREGPEGDGRIGAAGFDRTYEGLKRTN